MILISFLDVLVWLSQTDHKKPVHMISWGMKWQQDGKVHNYYREEGQVWLEPKVGEKMNTKGVIIL